MRAFVCVRDLNFSRSPSRCADTVRFFPFHLIFNGRAYIRGLCGGVVLFRGLEHARPAVYVMTCSTGTRTRVRIRATLKSRFAESQVGQRRRRRRFSAGEIIPGHKSVFLRVPPHALGHYCFPRARRAARFFHWAFQPFGEALRTPTLLVAYFLLP